MTAPVRIASEPPEVAARPDAGGATAPAGQTGDRLPAALGELHAAVTVLTRLPVRPSTGTRAGGAAYPVVGALVGLVGLAPLVGIGGAVPVVAAIIALAAMAIVTGAIHLDGLADTADALVALGPDGAERARKDPAVGVGGVVAIVLVLAADVAALAVVATEVSPLVAGLVCLVAGSASRAVPVILARSASCAAVAGGLGEWFATRTTTRSALVAAASSAAICLMVSVVLGSTLPLISVVAGTGGGLVAALALVRLRGQLDGDVLGAGVELAFMFTVVTAAVLSGAAAT